MAKEFAAPAGLFEEGIDGFGGVAVQHEDLADLGFGGAGEIQAVGFGAGQGLFVGFDGAAVVLELTEGDEAGAAVGVSPMVKSWA